MPPERRKVVFFITPWRVLTVFVLAMGVIGLSCGREGGGGSGGDGPQGTPTPTPTPGLELTTLIGLHPMTMPPARLAACTLKTQPRRLPIAPADHRLDGVLTEWESYEAAVADPYVEGRVGDLGKVFIARSDDSDGLDIIVAVQHQDTERLGFEFGAMRTESGELHMEPVLSFIAQGNQVWEQVDGALLPTDLVTAAAGLATELRFQARAVARATLQAAWWLRVRSLSDGESRQQRELDSTQTILYPAMISSDSPPFQFSNCVRWSEEPGFAFDYVADSVGSVTSFTGSRFPIEATSEVAFQLMRMSFDFARRVAGDAAMPVSGLAVVATTRKPTELITHPGSDSLLKPIAIDVNELHADATDRWALGRVFERGLARLLHMRLSGEGDAPFFLRIAMVRALSSEALKQNFGRSYYVHRLRHELLGFSESLDRDGAQGLAELTAVLQDPTDPRHAWAVDKAEAFGEILNNSLSPEELWAAYRQAGTNADDFVGEFLAALGPPFARLRDGWIDSVPYHEQWRPELLADADQDGLIMLIERKLATSDDRGDSDEDGWSDFAEWVVETRPTVGSDRPALIMPDGQFEDWFELIPRRLHRDEGRNAECSTGADITHFSALATRDHVVIAALARGFNPDAPGAAWQADVDFVEGDRLLLLVAEPSSHRLEIFDGRSKELLQAVDLALPAAGASVEWVLDRRALGIREYFNQPGTLQVRFRTLENQTEQASGDDEEGVLFCDDTEWVEPYIVATE